MPVKVFSLALLLPWLCLFVNPCLGSAAEGRGAWPGEANGAGSALLSSQSTQEEVSSEEEDEEMPEVSVSSLREGARPGAEHSDLL